jgi:hypothetical protein
MEEKMQSLAFQDLLANIRAGGMSPDQMEDVVGAIADAYKAHHARLYMHMSCDLRDVADEMYMGRDNFQDARDLEEAADYARTSGGYVHTVANVEGVSLERAV